MLKMIRFYVAARNAGFIHNFIHAVCVNAAERDFEQKKNVFLWFHLSFEALCSMYVMQFQNKLNDFLRLKEQLLNEIKTIFQ